LSAEPDIVQCQRAQAKFRYQYRTCFIQFPDHRCIGLRYAIAKRLRSIRGRDFRCIQQIFATPGNPVQRPARFSRRNFRVGLFCLL
jgi:hypothetical protein